MTMPPLFTQVSVPSQRGENLREGALGAQVQRAVEGRDAAQRGLEVASAAVEAAARELAGAEAGDGRDESNRSLQERLADAQRMQV